MPGGLILTAGFGIGFSLRLGSDKSKAINSGGLVLASRQQLGNILDVRAHTGP